MRKSTIKDVYRYVFEQLKCERLTAKPYCTNKKLLQLLTRLGFEYECTQERYYKEGDEVIDAEVYKLTKENIPKWVGLNA
jgi:RimJ/RimL family protein N-acetyltransferase